MKRALMIIGLAVAMTGASFAVQAEETDVAKVKCSEFIQDRPGEFQLNEMLLKLVEERQENEGILRVETYRMPEEKMVVFENALDENGRRKTIRCSNVLIRLIREE